MSGAKDSTPLEEFRRVTAATMRAVSRRDVNVTFVVHRISGIDAEVEKHLFELDRIDENRGHIFARQDAQLDR